MTVVTNSAAETEAVGEHLGHLLRPGTFIALVGELGSGKTCFSKGVAAGLGVARTTAVTSPTYTIMNVYSGRLPLYHFDLYRLSDEDVVELGLEDYFFGDGVCLVEWAERLKGSLPDDRLVVALNHQGEDRRSISFEAVGPSSGEIIALMTAGL